MSWQTVTSQFSYNDFSEEAKIGIKSCNLNAFILIWKAFIYIVSSLCVRTFILNNALQ